MQTQKNNQSGFLLGLVGVFFVLFTISGVTLLHMAYQSKLGTMDSVQKLKNKYDVESMVNLSLWEINTGTSVLETYGIPEINSDYTDSTGQLTVSTERYNIPFRIGVTLEANTGIYEDVWPMRISAGSWN